MKPFEILLASSHPEWGRYNVTLTAEGCDADGNRCGRGFYAAESPAGPLPDCGPEWEADLRARDTWGQTLAPAPAPAPAPAAPRTPHPRQPEGPLRELRLETDPCAVLHLYIYAIPCALPVEEEVQRHPDFAVRLEVRCGGELLRTAELAVNAWSGCSARFTFTA